MATLAKVLFDYNTTFLDVGGAAALELRRFLHFYDNSLNVWVVGGRLLLIGLVCNASLVPITTSLHKYSITATALTKVETKQLGTMSHTKRK